RSRTLEVPVSRLTFYLLCFTAHVFSEDHVFRQGRVLLPALGVEPRVGVGNGGAEVEAERVDGPPNGWRVAFDLDEVADRGFVEGHGAAFEHPFLPFLLVAEAG